MKKVIITGADGFIGIALVRELIDNGISVIAVVKNESCAIRKLTKANIDVSSSFLCFVESDISEYKYLSEKIKKQDIDVFYHFAWMGTQGKDLFDYSVQLQNVTYMLDAEITASKIGCKKFIGSGSGSQFELNVMDGRNRTGDKHSIFKYAKQVAQELGQEISSIYGIDFIWPYSVNPYGPGETKPRLINTLIKKLLDGESQPLSDGNQLYDFLFIEDEALAFRLMGENGKPNRKYILSSGYTRPLKEYLCIVRDIVSPESQLLFGKMPFNGIYLPKECFDNRELVEDTGFCPRVTFEEGIARTTEFLRELV